MPRFRQQRLTFPEVIHRAGDIGEHPPDGDRGPDAGDAERPCREIREPSETTVSTTDIAGFFTAR